ncbi:hypothetical protein KY331_01430 [Candidatus Woesearchaeota archaeon]|nr:hypothetical protein [Candidatus Woesearchaeota archaeon]
MDAVSTGQSSIVDLFEMIKKLQEGQEEGKVERKALRKEVVELRTSNIELRTSNIEMGKQLLEMGEANAALKEELASSREEHKVEVISLREEHIEEIDSLREEHTGELASLGEEHRKETTSLRDVVAKQQENLSTLEKERGIQSAAQKAQATMIRDLRRNAAISEERNRRANERMARVEQIRARTFVQERVDVISDAQEIRARNVIEGKKKGIKTGAAAGAAGGAAAGGAAGAAVGGSVGTALGLIGGPLAPVTVPIGFGIGTGIGFVAGLILGTAGGAGGGVLVGKAVGEVNGHKAADREIEAMVAEQAQIIDSESDSESEGESGPDDFGDRPPSSPVNYAGNDEDYDDHSWQETYGELPPLQLDDLEDFPPYEGSLDEEQSRPESLELESPQISSDPSEGRADEPMHFVRRRLSNRTIIVEGSDDEEEEGEVDEKPPVRFDEGQPIYPSSEEIPLDERPIIHKDEEVEIREAEDGDRIEETFSEKPPRRNSDDHVY